METMVQIIKKREEKMEILQNVLNLTIEEVYNLLPLIKDPSTTCFLIRLGSVFDYLFSVLYRKRDELQGIFISQFMGVFSGLVTYASEKEMKREQVEPIFDFEDDLKFGEKEAKTFFSNFDRFNDLAGFYTFILNIQRHFVENIRIHRRKKEIQIHTNIGKQNFLSQKPSSEENIFYHLIEQEGGNINIPSQHRHIFIYAIENSDFHSLGKLLRIFTRHFTHPYYSPIQEMITSEKKKTKFNLWIEIINLLYSVAMIYIRYSTDTSYKQAKILKLTDNELFQLFSGYHSEKIQKKYFLIQFTELYSKLSTNWFYNFCPYFFCEKHHSWVFLPFMIWGSYTTLLNNLIHLILEEQKNVGVFFEKMVMNLLIENNFSVILQDNKESFDKIIKGDIDIVVHDSKDLGLIQCKASSARKRKTFITKIKHGKRQISKAIADVQKQDKNKLKEVFGDYNNLYSFIVCSLSVPADFGSNPFNIILISFSDLNKILNDNKRTLKAMAQNSQLLNQKRRKKWMNDNIRNINLSGLEIKVTFD